MKHLSVLHKLIRTLSVLLLAFMATITLQAENVINVGANNTVEVITLPLSGHTNTTNYTITGTTTVKTITIKSRYQGTITLRNLNITSTKPLSPYNNFGMSGVSCITVEGEYNGDNLAPITNVEVILEGTNTLTYTVATAGCAFQVNQGAQIHINSIDRNDNSTGILVANNLGQGSAAIGAPYFQDSNRTGQGIASITFGGGTLPIGRESTAGGNIIIGSGTVTAKAIAHGAGIGGGWYSYYNGVIVVYGGTVVSTSGTHAAGIGSGCPTGNGVLPHYAPNSMIIALHPSKITASGSQGDLAGASYTAYMNDAKRSTITVHTQDNEKDADIYIDLSEALANKHTGLKLTKLFGDLGIEYDLKKVRVGRTSATNGLFVFNAQFKDKTTFFTDASSTFPGFEGRPYMPEEVDSIVGNTNNKVDVELKRLKADISFADEPSKPLEVGYTIQQAWENAHRIMIKYDDDAAMTEVKFQLQSELQLGVTSDFTGMKFFASDKITEISAPTTLNKGDEYYIVMPIVQGKGVGIYSDVLLIGAEWEGKKLPGYIRRIGMQRVVKNDTGINEYIKVKADPPTFIDYTFPATKTVKLTLNIDHKDTGANYNKLDVKAKYLITPVPDYDAALAATPINSPDWKNMNVAENNAQDQATTVLFDHLPHGTYYIHWYVESGVVYAHSTNAHNGFGPYIIAEPLKAGTLSGNPAVCAGQIPSEIKGEVSTGGSNNFVYQWQMSTDGMSWTSVGSTTPNHNYTPDPLTVSPTYFRRLTMDVEYGGGFDISNNVFAIYIVADNTTLYWNKNAMDNNWNNPANWVNESGVAQNIVPVSCSNVYIPGDATNYPSLHSDKTPTGIYGSPASRNITFEYGAELAHQHKLSYEKAYIRYNWGYYDNLSGANPGSQPSGNDCSTGSLQKRDVWYALAAPLKSMATGDFAFAGYPLTWQAGFALSDPSTHAKGGEIEVGNFDKTFARNDMPLSQTNNAIAVKVASYQNSLGCDDHYNLESLKGIVEIPYFENSSKSDYYPGHSYDRFTQESKFFYFNPKTLQLLHSEVGHMKRASEAYRFIYEKADMAPEISVIGTPSLVPGYEQKIKRQNSASSKVMIGNPFMASINAKRLFSVNSNNLLETDGYWLFDSNTQDWKYYNFADAGMIPPLQAFIVTLKQDEVNMLYPLEGTYALTGSDFTRSTPVQSNSNLLYLKSVNNKGLGGDYSVLAPTESNEVTASVKKMINPEGHATPETFFITPDTKDYNLVQTHKLGRQEVGIGVKSSDTTNELSLTFENVAKFYTEGNLRPVLIDKYTGTKQDLLLNNTYTFNQRATTPENSYIDADRFSLQLLSAEKILMEKENQSITVVYRDNQLEVSSVRNISQVHVYDMFGRRIYSQSNINTTNYTRLLSLNSGTYIVEVHEEGGTMKVEKIVTM